MKNIKSLEKAVLFVMVDDTQNCDDVAEYLQMTYPELSGDATFTIHTKKMVKFQKPLLQRMKKS